MKSQTILIDNWQPTNELRYKKTKNESYAMGYFGEFNTIPAELILQQRWIKEDNKSMKQYFEWRDVPIE